MLTYGQLTNPSNEILDEITNIHDLDFDYVEVGIEHTAYWIDLCSDYEYVRSAWILEAMREIGIAKMIGIDLISFHANLNGCFMDCKLCS